MKIKNIFILFSIFITIIPFQAQARSSIERPYMNNWESAYDSKWENRYWRPSDWISQEKNAQAVLDGFYDSGIITDQYFRDDVAVLEVGHSFLDLSGRDQRRVVDFVAYVFNIRGEGGNGVMHVVLKRQNTALGVYSRGQLQLH